MRLPPGQTLTSKFPIVGEKEPSAEMDLSNWELIVEGEVATPLRWTYPEFLSFPQKQRIADIHCVTSWSQFDMEFTGVPFRDLLNYGMDPSPSAHYVRFVAYSSRNHDCSIPLSVALEDVWLVHSFNGAPLTRSRGFPLRIITPSRYFYKSLKWVHRIILTETEHAGFWERTSGYHHRGDPWKEERLEGSRFTSSAELRRFREQTDFTHYREAGTVILKAALRGWEPQTLDLRHLRIKASDFRDARLNGVCFEGANLTLGNFDGADLRNSDFSGADLEGASFVGADISGARFKQNFLSATRFIDPETGRGLKAFEGAEMTQPEGLLEMQEQYLRKVGILK